MPEPAPIPLNEIPIVPIAQIGGRLLNGGELVNLAEYASRRADKLCGDETRAILASVEAIRTANQRAINANRAFMRGRSDPLAAVTMALRNKKETN